MENDDEVLLREIDLLADQADNAPKLASLDSMAATLATQFKHRSDDKITEAMIPWQ